jgi:hypothetical protein
MSVVKTSGVTISFTKHEIDWLGWLMTEVLGKAMHVPAHDDVKEKILKAVELVRATETAAD